MLKVQTVPNCAKLGQTVPDCAKLCQTVPNYAPHVIIAGSAGADAAAPSVTSSCEVSIKAYLIRESEMKRNRFSGFYRSEKLKFSSSKRIERECLKGSNIQRSLLGSSQICPLVWTKWFSPQTLSALFSSPLYYIPCITNKTGLLLSCRHQHHYNIPT